VLKQSWGDGELANTPWTALPKYWKATNDETTFTRGMLVINRKSLIAAKQAAQVVAAFLDEPVQQPARPTSKAVLAAISRDLKQAKRRETRGRRKGADDTGDVDKFNAMTRIWKPNRPVLHLCVATHMVIHNTSHNQQDINFRDFMHPATVAGIIGLAQRIAPAMLPCFGIKPDELVEVLLG
jgi:hypothetical protein